MKSRWMMAVGLVMMTTISGAAQVVQPLAATGGEAILSPTLLDYAGLRLAWQVNLPLRGDEGVARMIVQNTWLYILTTHNHLFCIERTKGNVRFGLTLAHQGLPIQEPSYYDEKSWFMIGNILKVVDPRLGVISETADLSQIGTGTVFGVLRNKNSIILADPQGRLRFMKAGEYWNQFAVTSDNNSPISGAIVDEDFVIFSTVAGNVVRIQSAAPVKQWQYDLSGGIQAPMVRDGDWLFVAGMDTKLYKLNILNGVNGWQKNFQTGIANTLTPIIGSKVVYQPVGERGLFAVDKETGLQRWHLPKGVVPLAEKGEMAYIFARPSTLVSIHNTSGKIDFTLNFTPIRHAAVNSVDSILYAADEAGRIASVEILPNR